MKSERLITIGKYPAASTLKTVLTKIEFSKYRLLINHFGNKVEKTKRPKKNIFYLET